MKDHTRYLICLKACDQAWEWADQYDSLQQAWDECDKGEWMLWLLGKQAISKRKRRKLISLACNVAMMQLPFEDWDDPRRLERIEAALDVMKQSKTIFAFRRLKRLRRPARYGSEMTWPLASLYFRYSASLDAGYIVILLKYSSIPSFHNIISEKAAKLIREQHPKIEIC